MSSKPFETLATKCRKTIASNIDRYPVESIGALPEMEWEAIVQLKYEMTAPKVQVQKVKGSYLLSDGRKFPLFTDKFMKEVEEKNAHLRSSSITDELVWKDCVDFKFRVGGTSRPAMFREPWNMQVEKLKSIGKRMEGLSPHDGDTDVSISSSSSSQQGLSCERKIKIIAKELQDMPMSVPLLSESGVGKSLKKLIKKLRKFHESAGSDDERNFLKLSTQLESLLQGWMDMASANGVNMTSSSKASNQGSAVSKQNLSSVSGQSRHTSNEQHTKDIHLIQKCTQWRDLFEALAQREKTLIKHHGAKMRMIRNNLEVGRPKIVTAKTKNKGITKVIKEQGGIKVHGSNHPKKLGKLRQEFKEHNDKIKGGKAYISISPTPSCTSQRSSFGSSVSSAMSRGKKKSSTLSINSNKRSRLADTVTNNNTMAKRQVTLGDGKVMKLPKMSASLRGRRL